MFFDSFIYTILLEGNAVTTAHGAISIYGAQNRVINCYIHGNKARSGIIAADQVFSVTLLP